MEVIDVFHITNTMGDDVLATQWAKVSAAAFTHFARNNPIDW